MASHAPQVPVADPDLGDLAELLEHAREPMLASWRRQVRELPSARELDVPRLNDHLPGLIDELVAELRAGSAQTIPDALGEKSSTAHGLQRITDAFDIEEVVAEYNILRGCIHDLADDAGRPLRGPAFHIVNRVLDGAIGLALETYATQRALEVQRRREEYLAFVAHDLRTPLNAISLAGRVLELTVGTAPGAGDEAGRMFKALRRNVRHLELLVGRILEENANLQTEIGVKLERRDLDLWSLVETIIHDLRPVSGTASTRLSNEVPEELIVYADAVQLRRVLQNLIANAIKHTERGEVAIGAGRSPDGAGTAFWVRDNGAGIPADFLHRVFEKGETDADGEGGMGLGLAIVKTLIEAHGGQVSAESIEGRGSTFTCTLPARADS